MSRPNPRHEPLSKKIYNVRFLFEQKRRLARHSIYGEEFLYESTSMTRSSVIQSMIHYDPVCSGGNSDVAFITICFSTMELAVLEEIMEQYTGVPDGLIWFAHDHSGQWGGYSVGYFTAPDTLYHALAEFDDHYNDTGNWALNSPSVHVVTNNTVHDLDVFSPDVKTTPVHINVAPGRAKGTKRKRYKLSKSSLENEHERDRQEREANQQRLLLRVSHTWTKLQTGQPYPVIYKLYLGLDGDTLKRLELVRNANDLPDSSQDITWFHLPHFDQFYSCEDDEFMKTQVR